MKYLILLMYAGIAIAVMNSCKKESSIIKSSKIANNSSSIIGTWELRQMVANVGTINYDSGNGLTLEFRDSAFSTTDAGYKFFIQGNHSKKGHYQIVADTSVNICTGLAVPLGQFANRIILDNDTTSDKIFYQSVNNKLIIISGYFPTDGGAEMTYEKQ